jgi:hypothetical protein
MVFPFLLFYLKIPPRRRIDRPNNPSAGEKAIALLNLTNRVEPIPLEDPQKHP